MDTLGADPIAVLTFHARLWLVGFQLLQPVSWPQPPVRSSAPVEGAVDFSSVLLKYLGVNLHGCGKPRFFLMIYELSVGPGGETSASPGVRPFIIWGWGSPLPSNGSKGRWFGRTGRKTWMTEEVVTVSWSSYPCFLMVTSARYPMKSPSFPASSLMMAPGMTDPTKGFGALAWKRLGQGSAITRGLNLKHMRCLRPKEIGNTWTPLQLHRLVMHLSMETNGLVFECTL